MGMMSSYEKFGQATKTLKKLKSKLLNQRYLNRSTKEFRKEPKDGTNSISQNHSTLIGMMNQLIFIGHPSLMVVIKYQQNSFPLKMHTF